MGFHYTSCSVVVVGILVVGILVIGILVIGIFVIGILVAALSPVLPRGVILPPEPVPKMYSVPQNILSPVH